MQAIFPARRPTVAAILSCAAALASPALHAAAAPETVAPTDLVPIATLVQSPSVSIGNGLLSAKIYLPDPAKGFYRGSRFDWAGMIGGLTYRGHDFYPPWFRALGHGVRDFIFDADGAAIAGPNTAATGPVEEFNGDGGALGYAEAAPGGRFVKIGVGVLQRPAADNYSQFVPYPIVDAGQRSTRARADSVAFTHTVAEPGSGYAYRYTKTVRLLPKQPVMVIEHELVNTGKRAIATQVYDHNFLNIDGAGTKAGLVLTTRFPLVVESMQDPQLATIAGNRVTYVGAMMPGQRVSTRLGGYGATAADYDFRISDPGGAGLRITSDQPLDRALLWSIRPVMAIEPFVRMSIAPGKSFRWSYTYAFEVTDDRGRSP